MPEPQKHRQVCTSVTIQAGKLLQLKEDRFLIFAGLLFGQPQLMVCFTNTTAGEELETSSRDKGLLFCTHHPRVSAEETLPEGPGDSQASSEGPALLAALVCSQSSRAPITAGTSQERRWPSEIHTRANPTLPSPGFPAVPGGDGAMGMDIPVQGTHRGARHLTGRNAAPGKSRSAH